MAKAKDMNMVILSGKISREDAKAQNGFTKFSLYVTDSYKKKDGTWVNNKYYFNVSRWGTDDIESLTKDTEVMVTGSLEQTSKTDANGAKKTYTNIKAESIRVLREGQPSGGASHYEEPPMREDYDDIAF